MSGLNKYIFRFETKNQGVRIVTIVSRSAIAGCRKALEGLPDDIGQFSCTYCLAPTD
jgi:hypothetical protein